MAGTLVLSEKNRLIRLEKFIVFVDMYRCVKICWKIYDACSCNRLCGGILISI